MKKENSSIEISLADFWKVFCKRFVYLILALVIGGGAAFGYTKFFVTPTYSCKAEFLVTNSVPSAATTSNAYLQGAAFLASTYAQAIGGNVFLEEVAVAYNDLYVQDKTADQLAAMLTVSASDTSVLTIRVTSGNGADAYAVLQLLEEMVPDYLKASNQGDYIDVIPISRGRMPWGPTGPNATRNTVLGAGALFVVVYVAFFLLYVLDKTIYHEVNVKENFDQPIIGQIPEWISSGEDAKAAVRKRKDVIKSLRNGQHIHREYVERLLDEHTPFSITEAFKTLRTNLSYAVAGDDKCPVFGVTSDFAGAGKSLIASNIAVGFSQLGKKVLLIDGDMRCPIQHKIFNFSRDHAGLSDYLTGNKKTLEECLYQTKYEGLDLLACGVIPPNPYELLASERMKKLLAEAKEKYDYILVDLPPVCATTDAGVIAPLLSGFALVARAGYSNINAMNETVDTLQSMHANIVGFVINDIDAKTRGYYNYYRSGRYGRYYRYYSKYSYSRYASAQGTVEKKEEEIPAVVLPAVDEK